MRCRIVTLLAVPLLVPAHASTVYVNSRAAGDLHDGASWQTAFTSVQAGLDAAKAGDEVWVAGGAYVERLWLKTPNLSVYGGFIGSETALDQRTPGIRTTIKGTSLAYSTITADYRATNAIIDGFNVSGGSPGIYLWTSNVTISNNTISGNGADGTEYGGIRCEGSATITGNSIQGNQGAAGAGIFVGYGASAVITHNTVYDNVAGGYVEPGNGGGIAVSNGSAVIKDNLIVHNAAVFYTTYHDPWMSASSGGGIAIKTGYATIANNTIADNLCMSQGKAQGGGVFATGAVTLANNLFFQNTVAPVGGSASAVGGGVGIGAPPSGQPDYNVQVHHNLFFNNAPDDGVPTGVNANLHADPAFPYATNGYVWNYHIPPGSPAIDAGDNAYVQPGDTDLDSQPRLLGPAVDLGAYESDATTGGAILTRAFVRADGDDRNDGSSWVSAKRSIGAALSVAANGGAVWVAQGTYLERVRLKAGISLLGGFAGNETVDYTNRVLLPTVIDARYRGTAVTIPAGADGTKVDGFIITHGGGNYGFGGSPGGGGVLCQGDNSTLSRNIVTGNRIRVSDEDYSAAIGAGIYVVSVTATITNNVIRDNTAWADAYTTRPSWASASSAQGGGIAAFNAGVTIANNLVSGNTAFATGNVHYYLAQGAGIYASGCSGLITNNTIAGNRRSPSVADPVFGSINGTFYIENSQPTLTVANNIVALNQGGLERKDGNTNYSHNDVFGNGEDFGPEGPLGGSNLMVDPLFGNAGAGDYRLQLLSPCIDVGDNTAVRGATDLDGRPRVIRYTVDLGAYEAALLDTFTVADAASALRIAAGLNVPTRQIFDHLNVAPTDGRVTLFDAIRVLRKAVGMDSNP